ncbi:MAG: Ycf34 family protein [Cyanobacteria bacterium J06635_11]
MCICVNCHYVDKCTTYHAVEHQHQQPHLTDTPTFDPNNPTINVNITPPKVVIEGEKITTGNDFGSEYDVVACDSYTEEMGKWAKLRPGEAIPT